VLGQFFCVCVSMIEPFCSVIQNSFESECMYEIIFKLQCCTVICDAATLDRYDQVGSSACGVQTYWVKI